MPARNASPASGRRAYSVSGTPWSASSSARPAPICPSPTIPTGPLVKQNLTPDDPGDQVDQLPERLHGVPAGEPCQLARVDRHVVLPLQLLEQSEKEERIEPEVVEQMRVVAHLADVPLQLIRQEALHLRAHLRPLHGGHRAAHGHRAPLVRHESSCARYRDGDPLALTTRLAARSQSKLLTMAVRTGCATLRSRTCAGTRQSGSSSSQLMVGGTRSCSAASRQAMTWSIPEAAPASPSIDLIALVRSRCGSAAKTRRSARASPRSPDGDDPAPAATQSTSRVSARAAPRARRITSAMASAVATASSSLGSTGTLAYPATSPYTRAPRACAASARSRTSTPHPSAGLSPRRRRSNGRGAPVSPSTPARQKPSTSTGDSTSSPPISRTRARPQRSAVSPCWSASSDEVAPLVTVVLSPRTPRRIARFPPAMLMNRLGKRSGFVRSPGDSRLS